MNESRASLRQRLRQLRRNLSVRDQRQAALALRDIVVTHPRLKLCRSAAFYWAADGEIDPAELMHWFFRHGRKVYLPVTTPGLLPGAPRLCFQAYHPGTTPLARNRFGIPEPAADPRQWREPHLLDVIFLPLVGFDAAGNRLGMGAGYYDRTLAGLYRRFRRPILAGLAHAGQQTTLLARSWDIPLDLIVTDQGIIDCSTAAN